MSQKVYVNFCTWDELISVNGVGEAIAKCVMAMRSSGAHITKDMFYSLPGLRVTRDMAERLDFGSAAGVLEVGDTCKVKREPEASYGYGHTSVVYDEEETNVMKPTVEIGRASCRERV